MHVFICMYLFNFICLLANLSDPCTADLFEINDYIYYFTEENSLKNIFSNAAKFLVSQPIWMALIHVII